MFAGAGSHCQLADSNLSKLPKLSKTRDLLTSAGMACVCQSRLWLQRPNAVRNEDALQHGRLVQPLETPLQYDSSTFFSYKSPQLFSRDSF